jgi:MFS family permease
VVRGGEGKIIPKDRDNAFGDGRAAEARETGTPAADDPREAGAGREAQVITGQTEKTAGGVPAANGANRFLRRGGPFFALSYRNFRLFFVGQMISVAGTWMQSVGEQWLVYSLTHSAAWLGIVSGASAIPYVTLTIYGGQLADRLPRRSILLCTQAAALVLAVLLAVLAAGWLVPIRAWHIAALAAGLGVVNAFNVPAQQAFVMDMVEGREALGNAIALNSLQFNLARVIGPIFAGWVLVQAGAAGCFFLNALSFVAVLASLLLMRVAPRVASGRMKGAAGVLDGFHYIVRTPSVLRVILLIGTGALLFWSVSTVYPVFASHFHQGAKGFSQMMAANGIGAACGGIWIATAGDRLSRRHLVYGGAALFGVTLIGATLSPTYPFLLVCLVFSGLAMMLLGINANTRVQQDVPDELRGRVMAVYSLVFGGLLPVGGLETGFVTQHLGVNDAVRINAGVGIAITAALFTWSQLSARDARTHPHPPR